MSEKRRDQRGRILKTGESHRKDGLYMFRYTDTRKQRRYIYARSLEELRRKEAEIQRDLADGIDYAAGGDDSTRTCHPVYGSEAHPEGKLLSRL